MSGLRHVLKTRTYRERSQPAARQHLGLLEKKKDYKLRAKDFHRKEDAIKKLKQKAALKNPDEFYFKMTHTKMEGGVHRKQAAGQPSVDDLRQFKREDAGYLMVKQTAEAKKIDRLRAQLHMLDAPLSNKHTVFVDNAEAAKAINVAARGCTPAERASAAPLRPERHQLGKVPHASAGSSLPSTEADLPAAGGSALDAVNSIGGRSSRISKRMHAKLERARAAQYDELEQRISRHSKMGHTLQRIAVEKALLGKGPRRKLKAKAEGGGKVFKFRQRRKK